MKTLLSGMAVISILLLTGCKDENASIDMQLSTLTAEQNLTGDPSTGRDIPSIDDPAAQLGMKLFFTKTLSIPGDTACVTCHHPLLGGGDGISISIGTGAVDTDIFGNERLLDPIKSAVYDLVGGGPTQSVNAPTTYNSALKDRFMAWHGIIEAATPNAGFNGTVGGMFDPDSLYESDSSTRIIDPFAGENIPAAQARFPVQNPIEMRGHERAGNTSFEVRRELLDRFTGENNNTFLTPQARTAWLQEFKKVYGDGNATTLITDSRIYNLISYYERTQLFIESPWKRYLNGDKKALSRDAKKGAILFYSSYENRGANCVQCHNGDAFTDDQLHVMAVPQIGLGTQSDGDAYGREDISKKTSDRYKWRTMPLHNVEKTGPWGHDGAFTTLRAIVKHMVNPSIPYDKTQVKQIRMQNLDKVEAQQAKALILLDTNHKVAYLSDEQIDQIVEFLKSLTDPRLNSYTYMKQWLPDYSDTESTSLLNLQKASKLPAEATQELN